MPIAIKPVTTVLAVAAMALSLQGCVAAALAPTALSLAAEGMSVHSTGKTISENLKTVILDTKGDKTGDGPSMGDDQSEQLASLNIAPIPPRKPAAPARNDGLMIKAQARAIGDFLN